MPQLARASFRERVERLEEAHRSPLATPSYPARRARPEPDSDHRTPFQRDRDRIVHSKAFRRLKHKTQVFIAPEGDHYRTRLTHTLEACGIARNVARALGLNEDLTEAIGLGHDLGHPPFGHIGEEVLDACVRERWGRAFRHNEHSLRVVERIEDLNLTEQVREGILRHTGPEPPATLEGRIVRLVDRIAYINHDIDDAMRGGILRFESLPPAEIELLGQHRLGAHRDARARPARALGGGRRHRSGRGGGRRHAAPARVHVRERVPRRRRPAREAAHRADAAGALRPLRRAAAARR